VIDASLEMPDKVRNLQIKLYRKAKNEPGFGFYQLYDKVYRKDILMRAYYLAKSNDGSPGADGESFAGIESKGIKEWLNGLGTRRTDRGTLWVRVRRKMIEKRGGGERALGILAPARFRFGCIANLTFGESFGFRFQVQRHMSEPGADGVNVRTSTEEVCRRGVANGVGADPFFR